MNAFTRLILLAVPGVLLSTQGALAEHTVTQRTLTLEGARAVAEAAVAYARANNAPGGAIAIVDDGGNLVYLERLDGTFPAGANISIGKARTAALFRKPTRVFEKIVNDGRTTMTTLPGVTPFTPLQGGVPLVVDGHTVGAIGVSGAASAQQDDDIAQAAADAFGTRTEAAITHVPARRVKAAFRKGEPLVDASAYKVNASRRDAPGEAEVHEHETDIFYVLDGSATLVTGGELVDPRITAPGELRASAIRNGQAQKLARGDVIVVPRGIPHWFEQVSPPFVYYVVKSLEG